MEENYYTVYQRDGYYYYYVYDKYGRRHKRATGIRADQGKKGKLMLQNLIAKRITDGTLQDPRKPSKLIKFKDFAKDYWNYDTCPYIQSKLERGGTFSMTVAIDNASSLEKYIMPVFGNKLLIEITSQMVKEWLINLPKKYGLSPHTANLMLVNIRHILDTAVEKEIIEFNPAKQVLQLIYKTESKHSFTKDQIQKLFAEEWYGERMQFTACYLSAATGMRLGEVRALTVEQVHTDYIEVNASWNNDEGRKTTKSGKPRIVPISNKVLYRLNKIMPSEGLIFSSDGIKPISCDTICNALKRKMEEIDIDWRKEKLSFHSFRYYANTRMKAAGVPEITVRACLGHSTKAVSEMYDDLSLDDMKRVLIIQENAV